MQFEESPATVEDLRSLALYNYGTFTSLRAEHHRVRGLRLHLERLERDSAALFGHPVDPDHVRALLRHALARHDSPEIVARVTVVARDLDLGSVGEDVDPQVLISTRPAPPPLAAPMRVTTMRLVRDLAHIKHVGVFPQVYRRRLALRAGFDDALFTDDQGRIGEGVTWNIAFIRSGQVLWPEGEQLPGVSMILAQQCLTEMGVDSRTVPVTLEDLDGMDAAFALNAVTGLWAISAINEITYPAEPELFTALRQAYQDLPGEPL